MEGNNRMHEGHRERVRERYKLNGFDGFADHEVLEMLLFYANRRGDTNGTAHLLLDSFGSLAAVFEAPYEELVKVKGVGDIAATLISMVPPLFRRYTQSKAEKTKDMSSLSEVTPYLVSKFFGIRNERVAILSLDIQSRLNNFSFICEGTISIAQVEVRKVVEIALRDNAHSIIVVHNHPNGVTAPSRTDVETTQKIINAMAPIGIKVADHIIISDFSVFSMSTSDKLAHLFL